MEKYMMNILSSMGTFAIIVAALTWLARSLFSQYLSRDIEKFKAKLQLESQRELAQIQSSLGIAAFEHQIRFSQLHEKRATIISELYGAIVELHKSVDNFIRFLASSSSEKRNSNLQKIWEAADRFKVLFEKNRIFFSEKICEKIENLNESMSKPISEIVIHLEVSRQQNWDVLGKTWGEAQKRLVEEIPIIKTELETDFRRLLGVLGASNQD